MAVGIDQREINIGDADVVDALFVQKEFGLKQHGDFLLGGVGSVQRHLEPIASGIPIGGFLTSLSGMNNSVLQLCIFSSYNLCVKNQ